MSLLEVLNENTLLLANKIHPSYDLENLQTDINYFIYSSDEYLNYLVSSEMIERFSNVTRKDLVAKECDNIPFYSQENVLCLDVKLIAKKLRQDIESFIRRIVKRKPLIGDKHIILIMNFDEICTKCQLHFKSLLESNFSNVCFIFTATKLQEAISNIHAFCMLLRTPKLSKKDSKNLLTHILKLHDNTLKMDAKVDDDLNLYAMVSNLNSDVYGGRSYTDVFRKEISDLIDYLKTSKKRTLEKVINQIRITVNKVLYYSIPDATICKYVAKKLLSLKKIDKNQSILKVCEAETNLIGSSKKIFVYELLFLDLYELLIKAY